MNPRLIPLLLLFILAGCIKPSGAPPNATAEPPHPPAAETAAAGPAATAQSQATATQTSETELATALQELTQVVRKYAMEKRKAPKSLEELVTAGYLQQVPQAPAGKKFSIDRSLQVQLINR